MQSYLGMKTLNRLSLIASLILSVSSITLGQTDGKLCRIILKAESDAAQLGISEAERTNKALGFDPNSKTIRFNEALLLEIAKEVEAELVPQEPQQKEDFNKSVKQEFNFEVVAARARAFALLKNILGPPPEERSAFAGKSDLEQNYYRFLGAKIQGNRELMRDTSPFYYKLADSYFQLEAEARKIILENDQTLENQLNSNRKLDPKVLKVLIKDYDCSARTCSPELAYLRKKLKVEEKILNRQFADTTELIQTIEEFIWILKTSQTPAHKQLAASVLAKTEKSLE